MKKILALILGGAVAAVGCAAALVLTHPDVQMEYMTNYVMKNLKEYNWSALKMEDQITPALTSALGEDHPESVSAFYGYMKDSAGQMTWEITATDPETLTSQVEVTYVDGVDFLDHYSAALCDHIMDSLEDGSLQLEDVMNVMEIIPDETNRDLILSSVEQSDPTKTKTAVMTLQFTKQYGVCIPKGTSDEVQDVVSAGLFNGMNGMRDRMVEQLLPRIVDRVFRTIQRFDEGELEALTGSSLSQMLGMEEDSPLYTPFIQYLRSCAAKMTYSVGDFRMEEGEIKVDCSFLDSKGVIQRYLEGAAGYIFSHLTNPIITDEVNTQLLESAIQASDEERVEKTVTITFDPEDYSKFSVSDEIQDVVSANLNSEISGMTEGFSQLANSITGGGWQKMMGSLMSRLSPVFQR